MTQKQNAAMDQAIDLLINNDTDVSTLFKEDGLLKELTKRLVEKALQSEMNNHLEYSKYNQSDAQNARNGYNTKNLITKNGAVEIEVPRDRNSSFEPSLVAKRQRRLDGFDDKVLSLYAKGMSLLDIKLQLQELYGADVSESLISQITDDIIEDVKLWQSRPLDPVYAKYFLIV